MEPKLLAEGDYREGLRWQIYTGPWGSLLAYVGVPEASETAGLHYDELDADEQCPSPHGGWTYSALGGGLRPAGWYWWGWDYNHYGDYSPGLLNLGDGHFWTLEEVRAEVEELLPQFDAWLQRRARVA